jgi:hypothetical protein
MCPIGLVEPGLCSRINVHAHRRFVIGIDRHALQTQFPPSRIELWNAPQFQLPSLHRVLIKAGARNPIATIATTINGHSTTNQKEILQSEFLGVGFLFMHFSQAFEDRHFTKRECERYETEDSNKHRHRKQRSDLAKLIRNVMRWMTRLPVM